MKYSNINTGEIKTHEELQRLHNISFPSNQPPSNWEVYTEAVDPVLVEKRRLKDRRDIGQYDIIEVQGHAFDANRQAQTNIQTAIRKFGLLSAPTGGLTIEWTLADNSTIFVTQDLLEELEDAIILRFARYHKEYTDYKKLHNLMD